MTKPFIITIVGAESSGKTTLASLLSTRMDCPWVPEYARDYLSTLDRPYQQEDLNAIALGQIALMREAMAAAPNFAPEKIGQLFSSEIDNPVIIFKKAEFGNQPRPILIEDGGLLTIRMWALIKFGTHIPLLEDALQEYETAIFILCRPLPEWTPDPLREAPRLLDRSWIYNQYLSALAIM